MFAPRSRVIIDILEEHFEELSFFWGQRMAALNSAVFTLRDLRDLEERIEAHTEGLLVGEDEAIQWLAPQLTSTSPNDAFASAYPLLRLKQTDATQMVWDALSRAQGKTLTGLCQALCACCPNELKRRLLEMANGLPSFRTAAALEVLAFHSAADVRPDKVTSLVNADNPCVRQAGWRIVALADVSVPQDVYEKALVDKNASVRHECLLAAAWTRQLWTLDYCREYAEKESPADPYPFRILAVLGQPDDLHRILFLSDNPKFGSRRFEWIGAYGNPKTIDCIVAGFESQNPREAVAAGAAFSRITGFDVCADTRLKLPMEAGRIPDGFESEFLDEALQPDLKKAQACWQNISGWISKGTRWCHGYNLSEPKMDSMPQGCDTASSYENLLRIIHAGLGTNRLVDFEHFQSGRPGVQNDAKSSADTTLT